MMRHSLCIAVAISCGVGAATLAAQTQPASGYIRTYCVKVQPGKDVEFRKLMSDTFRAVGQVRADAGEYKGRALLRTVFPAGAAAECDYMMTNLYTGFPPDPKASMSPEVAHQKAHVMSASDFFAKRDATSRLRRTELWRVVELIGALDVGNYIRLDYMKVQPDQRADWLKNERDTYKAIHQANIDLDAMKAWSLNTLMMPSGSSLPYDAMTGNVYKNWTQIDTGRAKYAEAFKKAHPNMDLAQTSARGAKLRDLVRTELYEVVDMTKPATSTSSTQ